MDVHKYYTNYGVDLLNIFEQVMDEATAERVLSGIEDDFWMAVDKRNTAVLKGICRSLESQIDAQKEK